MNDRSNAQQEKGDDQSAGWPEESCLKALKQCAEDIGYSPPIDRYEEWRESWMPSLQAFRSDFESWNDAKREAELAVYCDFSNGEEGP